MGEGSFKFVILAKMAVAQSVKFPAFFGGAHAVGCVDLMHRDLLVRLFYPTVGAQGAKCTRWIPSSVYAEAYIEMVQTLLPSMPFPPANDLISTFSSL